MPDATRAMGADTPAASAWPGGPGEMAGRMRVHDWAATPLGPTDRWPDRLRAVVELMLASPMISSVVCGPDRLLLYNDTASTLYGDRHPGALGQPLFDTFPGGEGAIGPLYDRAFAGEPVHVPAQSLDIGDTGREVFDAYLTPVRAPEGDIRWVHMTGFEIGERWRSGARLLESETRAFLLGLADRLRPLGDPVEIMDAASEALGRHLRVGRCGYGEVDAGEAFFTVERDWTDGRMPSLVGRHRMADFGEAAVAIQRAGKALIVDDCLVDARLDGDRAAWGAIGDVRSSLGIPLHKGGRWVAGFFLQDTVERHWTVADEALAREVAERTWAAVERARAESALRAADRRKDAFLATLAHELRNPLAPIRHALVLLRGRMPDATTSALRDTVERQVDHMVRLVDDLLDVSRISRDAIALRLERIDLRDVAEAALAIARPTLELGGHAVDWEWPDAPLPIDGDAVRLTQVFFNLLHNAARHSDAGGRITIAAAVEGGDAVASVRDGGIGIDAAQLPRLFNLFGRIDHPDGRTDGGLGIGLHLAERLARMHGGSVRAESAGVGLGSTFTVRLPLAPGAAADQAPAPAPTQGSAGRRPLAGRRILVVDDNVDAAEVLAMLLSMHGAEVEMDHDGEAVLARLDANGAAPSAVLLDIGLPGLDGHAVARRIRADRRWDATTLIALTGWGQQADRQRSLAAGFDHHLTKPVAPDVLLRTLQLAAG